MSRRLRLLWVTPSLPRRGRSAFQERTWALLQQLAPRHEVHLLVLQAAADAAVADDVLPQGLAAVQRFTVEPQWAHDPFGLLPAPVRAGLADPRVRPAVAAAVATARFDAVQYELIELGHVMPVPTVPTVLSVHQLSSAQVGPQWRAAGGALRTAPTALFRRWREADFEARALRRAHRIVTLSTADAARVQQLAPGVPVSIVPMGVDCTDFTPRADVIPTTDLLFVGHFGHPPNADAAGFLVREVLPRIERPLRLRIVGHAPTAAVQALALPGRVEVVGSVPDVRAELAAARIVLAPVRFGTGMRGKVLEALAMGRPVVTTSLGAEGLGTRDGEALLLADDARACAAAITRLLDEPRLAAHIGAAGRQLAVERFDWPIVAAAQEAVYAAVRGDPAPTPSQWVDEVPRLATAVARTGRVPALLAGGSVLAARTLRRALRA